MGFRQFTERTGWEQARREARYTASSLAAHLIHSGMAVPLRSVLADWNTIDQARRDAEDGVVDTNAAVRMANLRLNEQILLLAGRLRYELKSDDHPMFRKFFPKAPNTLTRQSLEAKLERVREFHTVVATEVSVSEEVQAILNDLAAAETAGQQALSARTAANDEVAKVSLRISAWKDRANTLRRGVENTLDQYANDQKMSRDYVEQFFLPSTRPASERAEQKPDTPPKPPAPQQPQPPKNSEAPQAPQPKA